MANSIKWRARTPCYPVCCMYILVGNKEVFKAEALVHYSVELEVTHYTLLHFPQICQVLLLVYLISSELFSQP